MGISTIVHGHALVHGLREEDIVYAWEHFLAKRMRVGGDYWVAVGFDRYGHEIEMVAAALADGRVLIIHAMCPATEKVKRELGLSRRR